MTTAAVQTASSNLPVTLDALIKKSAFTERFKEVLGEKAPQFMSSLLAVGRSLPDVEPKSIIAAGMQAAVLDLPIEKSLGFAWIVPYREGNTKYAQFQIGYKGFIQLALRSGYYERMNAVKVCEGAFSGFDNVGEPIIDWEKIDETKPAIGFAFAFKLTSGFSKVVYWSLEKTLAHAKRYSQSFQKGAKIWKDERDAMCLKTVIKNALGHWGILSVQFQKALQVDQGVIDVEGQVVVSDEVLLTGSQPEAGTQPAGAGAEADPNAAPATETAVQQQPSPPEPAKSAEQAPAQPAAASQAPAGVSTPQPAAQSQPSAKQQAAAAPVAKPARATMVEGKVSPQQMLEDFVIRELGLNFTVFQKWAQETGWVDDPTALGSFDQVPTKVAERLLRSKAGLMKQLNEIAGNLAR